MRLIWNIEKNSKAFSLKNKSVNKKHDMKNNNLERTRCEIWTRVMGYHRPVGNFNRGKKAEHYSRKHFEECAAANRAFTERYGTVCK